MKKLPVFVILLILFVSTPSGGASQRKKIKKVKVLILGAGAAGITAAKELYDNGVKDFLILEGQDYIGGRLKQKDFHGVKIEEGANWVHGTIDENPLYKIMKKYNFRGIYSNYDDFIVRNATGHDITDQKVIKRYEKILKKLDKLSENHDENHDISIKEAERLVGWTAKTQMEKAIERYKVDFEYAMQSKLASFNGWGSYDSDFLVVDDRGFSMFLFDMIKPFKEKVLLEKTVNSIKRSASHVTVTTNDKSVYIAEYVLSTFSNGVLSSNMVKFYPDLPRFKKKSLRKVQMADYTKIWLKFPHKFWDDKEFVLFGTDIDGGYYHTWQDLERPGILPPGSGVLLMTCTEKESRRIEAQTDEETLKEIMGLLRGVYGKNIPDAEDIFYSRWSLNNYTRGAYSNAKVGTTPKDFRNIARNLGRLFFAGEGTTYDLFGYAQGALVTGYKKGRKMLACIAGKPYPYCPVKNI